MKLDYKNMTQDELLDCATLFAKCFQQDPWNEEWTIQQALDRLQEIMSSPHALGYTVYHEGKMIGMLCGRVMTFMDFKEFWIDDFCISNNYQGKGLGSQFLDEVKIFLKDKEISRITLNTTRGFLSDKFYKKNGFKESDNLVTMYYCL